MTSSSRSVTTHSLSTGKKLESSLGLVLLYVNPTSKHPRTNSLRDAGLSVIIYCHFERLRSDERSLWLTSLCTYIRRYQGTFTAQTPSVHTSSIMGKFTLLSERTNGEPSSSASLQVRCSHRYCLLVANSYRQDELELLEDCPNEIQSSKAHDTSTAPLIMRDAYIAGLKNNGATQYGVLGKTLTVRFVPGHMYSRRSIDFHH